MKIYTFFLFYFFFLVNTAFAEIAYDAGSTSAIHVGPTTLACDSTTEGSIRVNTTSNEVESCDGTNWTPILRQKCSVTFSGFDFTQRLDLATNTQYTSNVDSISAFTNECQIPVYVTGQGNPQIQVCANISCSTVLTDWTSGVAMATGGNLVRVRATSPSTGSSVHEMTVFAGLASTLWSLRTAGESCADSHPPHGLFCADGTVFAGFNPNGGVKMYTTPCDQGKTWDGTTCTGTSITRRWAQSMTIPVPSIGLASGAENTTLLAGLVDTDSPYSAAIECDNLVFGGHSDWYLPALEEVKSMVAPGCGFIPDFNCDNTADFWTSSQVSASSAHSYRKNGALLQRNKTDFLQIRCIRKD